MTALRQPGYSRAGLWILLGAAVSWLILFAANAFDAGAVEWDAFLRVALLTVPLFFLVGLGVFDYWLRWASGAPIMSGRT